MMINPRTAAHLPAGAGGPKQRPRTVTTLFVHVTTGTNLGDRDPAKWIHNIYDYHTRQLRWSDIGYNWLVDRTGQLWTGRGEKRVPAAQKGYNTGSYAVALLGGCGEWTDEAYEAVVWLDRWLRDERGASIELYRGHRDVSSKACPCDDGMDLVVGLSTAGKYRNGPDPEPEPDPEDDMAKIELWTGPDPDTSDSKDHVWLVERDLSAPGEACGWFTRLDPGEVDHWRNLAQRDDRPDVIEAEARANWSWFVKARLKRKKPAPAPTG